ncbi:hypothetical protein IE81DRAFT_322276 [Ceraceosorus guamensis]|uniref:Secreted protein n=1 Tax=Ceraceosorus guamensis TaxID=1522189 RepID=A0A316W4P2_9BASI|nr:hypothetical protein IE81DRAFT_322276 [Ceraceosorus guamensis]PWN43621.1 hypothetical protein IE81DRAFT_322276 [Ceraceosorus guamensis]
MGPSFLLALLAGQCSRVLRAWHLMHARSGEQDPRGLDADECAKTKGSAARRQCVVKKCACKRRRSLQRSARIAKSNEVHRAACSRARATAAA